MLRCGLLFLISAHSIIAQVEQATVTGTVNDAAGGLIPSAKVTAVNSSTQVRTQTMTNETGTYRLP